MKMTPRDLMRAQYVNRWQIVPTSRPQNVAQHSWAVAMLAMDLWCRRTGGQPGEAATDVELGKIAVMALWHDAPEVFTGDVNTPTKIYLEAGRRLANLEMTAGRAYVNAVGAGDATDDEHDLLVRVVKIADFLEAMYWLMEHGEGHYANDQLHGLNQRFNDYLEKHAPLWRKAALELWKDLSDVNAETTTFQRVNRLMAGS